MTMRVIVQTCDASMACGVGGSVHTTLDTFDIEASLLEAFLREKIPSLGHRQVIGVELRETPNG